MKFVLDQTFHQNNCVHQNRFWFLMHLRRFHQKKILSYRVECKKLVRLSVFRIFDIRKFKRKNQNKQSFFLVCKLQKQSCRLDLDMAVDTSMDDGTVYSQRNQFVSYDYQTAAPRMSQAVPGMKRSLMSPPCVIPQQREPPASF